MDYKDTIERLVDSWSAEYRKLTAPVIEKIQKSLAAGDGPEEAVRKAFTATNLDARLANTLLDAMGVAVAEAVGPGATIKPSGRDKLLTLPWTADNMPLSQRLHGAGGTMRQKIIDEVQGAINKGEAWKQTAKRLYDGYGFPTTIQSAELPQYLTELLKASREMPDGDELRRLLRKATRQIRLLGQDGAPNQALKAAYKGIAKAVATGTDKAIDRAVTVGVEEKSRYYAERIARTEMSRAWAEGFWAQYGGDDLVAAVRWRLSSRHPRFDICDFHAHANLYGIGKGVYPKDRAPAQPAHPHCLCHMTPVFFNEVGKPDPDKLKQRGDAYLASLDEADRKRLLTIDGEQAWQNGRDWQSELRGWKGHQNFAGRLTKQDFVASAKKEKPMKNTTDEISGDTIPDKVINGKRVVSERSPLASNPVFGKNWQGKDSFEITFAEKPWDKENPLNNRPDFFVLEDGTGVFVVSSRVKRGDAAAFKTKAFRAFDRYFSPLKEDVFVRVSTSKDDIGHLRAGTHRGSRNWATGEWETGYDKKTDTFIRGISVAKSPELVGDFGAYVKGREIGSGSDGEPLVEVSSVKVLGKDYTRKGIQEDYEKRLKKKLKQMGLTYDDYLTITLRYELKFD